MGKLEKFLLQLGLFGVLAGVICYLACLISPSFHEKILYLGLASGTSFIQEVSAEQLREHPTKAAAVALIIFINAKAPSEATIKHLERQIAAHQELLKDETLGEEKKRQLLSELVSFNEQLAAEREEYEASFKQGSKLANAALGSLRYLSGESFSKYYEQPTSGFVTQTVTRQEWDLVLGRMNSWAIEKFSADVLSAFGGLLDDVKESGEINIEFKTKEIAK